MKRITYSLIFISFLLFASTSFCLVRFDFEQMYFFEDGYRIKDHCIMKIDSLYHLYYIRAPLSMGGPDAEDSLGHAVSPDLIHWTVLQPVISVVPGTWEEEAVWAPHVIRGLDGKYYMFYTGVNSFIAQATGLATSIDGFTWIKSAANPVYIPDTTWAQWNGSLWSDCRDPFIFLEDGVYYMLTTTMAKSGRATIAYATSTDLVNWTDRGPLYTHQGPQYSNSLESPFLLKKFGRYHLFFSEYRVAGTSYFSSDSLLSGWDLSQRIIVDMGGGAEVLQVSGEELFSRYITFPVQQAYWYAIKIDSLKWEGGTPLVPIKHPLEKDWKFISGTAFNVQSTFGDNTYIRSGIPSGLEGNCWIGTYERFQGPLQPRGGIAGDYQGDGPTGELRSNDFILEGSTISLIVGGGNKPDSLYVALCDACDDRIVYSETGENQEMMSPRTWDIGSKRGRRAYIQIVDKSSSSFGHINVDAVVETGQGSGSPNYPDVSVLVPNGGEIWDEQSQQQISWSASSPGGVDSVSIFYSTNGGITYTLIVSGLRTEPPYLWTVPSKPSDSCKIRVTAYTKAPFGWCDQSDYDFIILDRIPPQVQVFGPEEGDTLMAGTAAVISWITTDNGQIDSTSIYLSVDGGRTYPYVVVTGFRYGSLHGDLSEFLWNVPNYYSDSCRVSVRAFDHGQNIGVGESGLFTILRSTDVGRSDRNLLTFPLFLSSVPNPFSSEAVIIYSLPLSGDVRVDVFSVEGKLVKTLFQGRTRAGNHSVVWDGRDLDENFLPSGVYILRLKSGKDALSKKIVFLR